MRHGSRKAQGDRWPQVMKGRGRTRCADDAFENPSASTIAARRLGIRPRPTSWRWGLAISGRHSQRDRRTQRPRGLAALARAPSRTVDPGISTTSHRERRGLRQLLLQPVRTRAAEGQRGRSRATRPARRPQIDPGAAAHEGGSAQDDHARGLPSRGCATAGPPRPDRQRRHVLRRRARIRNWVSHYVIGTAPSRVRARRVHPQRARRRGRRRRSQ